MTHDYSGWIKEATFRVSSAGIPRNRLDEVGWTDFQSDPPPAPPHLHEFVATAVELCCLDDDGAWVRVPGLLVALVRATETVMSAKVPIQELAILSGLVEQGSAELKGIRFWFHVHFGPRSL